MILLMELIDDSAVLTLNRQGDGANTQPQIKVYITKSIRHRIEEPPQDKGVKPVGVNQLEGG